MPESRAAYVQGLETELAYLERQPVPNARRVADVKAQLNHFAKNPEKLERETAVKSPGDPEAVQQPAYEHVVTHDAPAKKAAAKRTAKKA